MEWALEEKNKLQEQSTMSIRQLIPISIEEVLCWGGYHHLTIDEWIELGPEQGRIVREKEERIAKHKRAALYLELMKIREHWEGTLLDHLNHIISSSVKCKRVT